MTSDDPTDADFAGLLDEARGSQAARSRSSRRWLRQQSLEEARLTGILLNAAEQHATVTVRTTSGRSHAGTVRLVGGDFCALQTSAGASVFIRTDAISVVQPDRDIAALPASDDREGPVKTLLVEHLADHAAEQPEVSFVCAGQREAVPGRLLAVGVDVATVEADERRGVVYVALSSVTEAWVGRVSG